MAPSATVAQSTSTATKAKRQIPPGIQTNGINSSTSSPSPSMSAGRLPPGSKHPNSVNGVGSNSSAARSANRIRRDPPGQLLGRGQRNSSAGMRSASLAGEIAATQNTQPPPYIQTDAYILKKFRGNPPSLIIHMHPTHFRFDQMEGSFSYKSPMKLMLDHLRERTVPHDLIEFFLQSNVKFYEGCMIVQIHDHKSIAPSQASNKATTGVGKTTPFSVHNYNAYLTPSPYVPYPTAETTPSKGAKTSEGGNEDSNPKSAEQKDKENMPAPAIPVDGQRSRAPPKKAPVRTIVLHPTELSRQFELALKATTPQSADPDGRSDSRQDSVVPFSAAVPQPATPLTAVPPTPQTSMPPPAKRQRKTPMELDNKVLHAFESKTTLLTTAPLILDPVDNAVQSARLLESLAHPMHSEKVPAPKARKRTVAEMAADEALAAEEERYMLILDERLSSSTTGAQGGSNAADGDGQAGGASFEPRFEKFKALENIKLQLIETKKAEKIRQQEADRKRLQDNEREKLRLQHEVEKRKQEENRAVQQLQQQANARAQQQEAHRRAMAVQSQQQPQGMQNIPQPMQQPQHGHPQTNNGMPNSMQGQPQRFHQQVSQAQISSPIVRNGTPQSHGHSSPVGNNMGNVPMQQSTSSMGGSPPRPGSVVHQNHQPMGAPMSHPMSAQRSQQSHAGTPRMPNSTPLMQSTPLNVNRSMSQTPRMSQGSPLPGPMSQGQIMPQVMPNGQQMNQQAQQLAAHQQMLHQQMLRRNQQAAAAAAAAAAQGMGQMANGQAMNPQQFAQAQHMMQQRLALQQQQQQQGNPMSGGQISQQYAAQVAAMAQRQQGMLPQNMQQNFMNNNGGMMPTQQQLQQLQQMQQLQQAQQQHPQMAQQQNTQAMLAAQANKLAGQMFQQQLQAIHSQYPGGPPEEIVRGLKMQAHQNAQQQVQAVWKQRKMQAQQQQMMMAAQNGMQQNGMQNGMNMQRPQGM